MDVELAAGAAGEDICRQLLELFGAHVYTARERGEQRAGIDLWVADPDGHREYSVQVKHDVKSRETGRAFIETETVRLNNIRTPSGIATCRADVLALVFPGHGVLMTTSRLLLDHVHECDPAPAESRVNDHGSGAWLAAGWLVRVERLVQHPVICKAWYPERLL